MFHFQNAGYWACNWLLFGREVQPITGTVLVFEHGSGGHVGFGIGQDALIRSVLTVAGTALVAMGYVQASDIEPVIGALLTIGSVVWSVADKRLR
ncbi:hypothetical protein [Oceaniovalibus sp. ACAM 378]|uniref:Pam3-gp28 family putative phage holin n=1 Tax=Oceaniovalibus sp. ACAM 378 TaxID=2599923 RepID=UPI0021068E2F|nr:hypothetical protein [Oceaniovalibus sp. ACAM 378]